MLTLGLGIRPPTPAHTLGSQPGSEWLLRQPRLCSGSRDSRPKGRDQGPGLKSAMPEAQYIAVPNDPAKLWVPGPPSTW